MSGGRFDIVVIGAGVAGGAFAATVARNGMRVLLVERSAWPREKVCGCCLNGAAMSALDRLGLGGTVERSGAPLGSVRLRSGGREASIARGGGVALSRGVLDALLVDRAGRCGVEFRERTAGAVVDRDSDRWRVRLRTAERETSVSAGLVVCADGLNGGSLDLLDAFGVRVSKQSWFGAGAAVESADAGPAAGVVEMNIGRHGYVGLVRLDDERVNIGAALDPVWTRRIGGPAAAVAAVLEDAGAPALRVDGARFSGTGMLTRRRERVSAPGLLVVGDSAGYVEPFTGEGMAWALCGGVAAAEMVNAGMRGADLADAWTAWHAERVRPRQRVCAAVRGMLRRPRLVEGVLAVMGSFPAAARGAAYMARSLERPYGDAGVTA